jgi:hypothetical protein
MTFRLSQTLAACAALAGFALCSVPAHSTPVTLTFSGTISDGYDTAGLFGAANRSLTGLLATTTYSFDLAYWGNNWWSANGRETITVDGVSKDYALDGNSNSLYSYVQRDRTDKGPGSWVSYSYYDWWYGYYSYSYYQQNYDQLYEYASGYTSDGGYLSSYSSVYSYSNPMSIPVDGSSHWNYTLQSGDNAYSYTYLYDQNWGTSTYFSNNVASVSLNKQSDAPMLRPLADTAVTATTVPEPATVVLVGLALVGAVAARCQRRAVRRR